MPRTIDLSRTVRDLVADNPEVATIMRDLGFADIAKPMALETVGRVMTIPRGAQIKGIDLAKVVDALEAASFEVTGRPGAAPQEQAPAGEKDAAASAADGATDAGPAAVATDEAGRARLLSSYVSRLSAGEDLKSVRREFVANFSDVDAAEIARAEQGLIEGGAKVEDVQRLCDVHSALFHGATREERIANAEAAVMESIAGGTGEGDFKTRVLAALKGHPVNVLSLENKAIAHRKRATPRGATAPPPWSVARTRCATRRRTSCSRCACGASRTRSGCRPTSTFAATSFAWWTPPRSAAGARARSTRPPWTRARRWTAATSRFPRARFLPRSWMPC